MKRSDAIKLFLKLKTRPDLAELYTPGMEVQVNVKKAGGQVTGDEIKGRKSQCYHDNDGNKWYAFRMPKNAWGDPVNNDTEMSYAIDIYADAIGMTGWDFENKCSRWVAFDFDAIVGHSANHARVLTPEQLVQVRDAACSIPYVTVRKSTAGAGLHLYVHLDPPIPTSNHTEHAALARAILSEMSGISGFNFESSIDVAGGNMWVWATKMEGTDGLTLVKAGYPKTTVPINWREHVKVVSNKGKKSHRKNGNEVEEKDINDAATERPRTPLDVRHKQLIDWLSKQDGVYWWDSDNHMLVTHTKLLAQAHTALGMEGLFRTSSPGTDLDEQNCFCFPMLNGAWSVRRFGVGTPEDSSWTQDSVGWTMCYLNRKPDVRTASMACGGIETEKQGYRFATVTEAREAAFALGQPLDVPELLEGRTVHIKELPGNRVSLSIDRDANDPGVPGWVPDKRRWVKVFNVPRAVTETEIRTHENVRHVAANGKALGWVVQCEGKWIAQPLQHVKPVLIQSGIAADEVQNVIGTSVLQPWEIISEPFKPEYPGGRKWNKDCARFAVAPSTEDDLSYPTWTKILRHCGAGLDEAISRDPWCIANDVQSGADYLKLWIASVIQFPYRPLPYLFFYSEKQDNGKSTFHEAMTLIIDRGIASAKSAMLDPRGFNAEIASAVVCTVEEVDLRTNRAAANRIKDWVTARMLQVSPKGLTPYEQPNTTHWVQTANSHTYCPILSGDTRITMINVPDLKEVIPREDLYALLRKEASDFLGELVRTDIPKSGSRLNLPVIETIEKSVVKEAGSSILSDFIDDQLVENNGQHIEFHDLYTKFIDWVTDESERRLWTKKKFSAELPPSIVRGKSTRLASRTIVCNVCYKENANVNNGEIYRRRPDGFVYSEKLAPLHEVRTGDGLLQGQDAP